MFKFLFKTAALVTAAGLALEGIKRLEEAEKTKQEQDRMPQTAARETAAHPVPAAPAAAPEVVQEVQNEPEAAAESEDAGSAGSLEDETKEETASVSPAESADTDTPAAE